MPAKESERVQALFQPIWDKREKFSALENLSIHKDGSLVYLETSGVPIFDAKGEFRGYRGLDRNITERKEKERELQLAATVLETATEAVMVTDVDKRSSRLIKRLRRSLATNGMRFWGKRLLC
nr:PAS domain S-box protein [Aliamphritea spongicola]